MAKPRSIDKLREEETRIEAMIAQYVERRLAAKKNRQAAQLAEQRQWERHIGRLAWDAGLNLYDTATLTALFEYCRTSGLATSLTGPSPDDDTCYRTMAVPSDEKT